MSEGRRFALVSVMLAGLLLAASGCTGERTEVPETPAKSDAAATPSVTPATPSARRLWGRKITDPWPLPSGTVTLVGAYSFDLVGDALVVVGTRKTEDDNASQQIVVTDARTGVVRWSLYGGDPLGSDGDAFHRLTPGAVVDRDGDWKLLVEYVRPGADRRTGSYTETGIMALSGRDGRVVWRAPVDRVSRRGARVRLLLDTVVGDRVVLVTSTYAEGDDAFEVAAFSPATGAPMWTLPGTVARFVTGDVVLVERPILPVTDPLKRRMRTTVAGVRLDDGSVLWDAAGRYAQASHLQATDGAVVVDVEPGSVVLDASTGRELTATPQDLKRCFTDNAGPVACTVVTSTGPVQKHLAIVERSGAAVDITSVPNSGNWVLQSTWKGRLICASDLGGPPAVLDRSGNTLDLGVKGRIYALDDDLVVFSPTGVGEDQQGEFAVHAVAS